MTNLPENCEVAIIGSGPAGLATAIELKKLGVNDIIVLERADEAGGNPRHCGHSPFGIKAFKRVYFGPAYAKKLTDTATAAGINTALNTTVTMLGENGLLTLSTPNGVSQLQAKQVVISTGIREMPRAPRFVSGQRPMGIMTTGALQSIVYLSYKKPVFKRPVIIGSELVAFSAIATCWHAGIKPVAIIEKNPRITAYSPLELLPKVLGIRLLKNYQLFEIEGKNQVSGVTLLDQKGIERRIDCDGVIFTGRFTPEASLPRMGHLEIDPKTQGPVIDQFGRCSDPCYFATGNVLRPVETGEWCWSEGVQTAHSVKASLEGKLPGTDNQLMVDIANDKIKYVIPQRISQEENKEKPNKINFQLRFNIPVSGTVVLKSGATELASKKFRKLPERRALLSVPVTDKLKESEKLKFLYFEY